MTDSPPPLPYGRQHITEDDIAAVVECLRSPFLTQGPRVAEFEAALCEATGAKHSVAVSSGTAALHLAYLALGLGVGDVGITSPISFVATSNGLLYVGASVAFADVDPRTGLLTSESVDSVASRLAREGRPPRVITPVDLAGQPTDHAEIQAIARQHGSFVLDDCAHSLGATYEVDGKTYRAAGCAHADAAILSFHPVKAVTTAEGGAITTNDSSLYQRLLELRTHGIHRDPARILRDPNDAIRGPWYYEQASLGYNYRLTDLQCALGLSQMRRLAAYVERRQAIARRYDSAFESSPLSAHFAPLAKRPGRTNAHHLYVVQLRRRQGETLRDVGLRRRKLFTALADQRIHCQVHYIPIPMQPYYRDHKGVIAGEHPGAEDYYATSISLPMFPSMTDSDADRVLDALSAHSAQ